MLFLGPYQYRLAEFQVLKGIAKLKNLKNLDVSFNQLKDYSFVLKFRKLEYLNLSGNQLSRIYVLTSLQKLSVLDISHNQLVRQCRCRRKIFFWQLKSESMERKLISGFNRDLLLQWRISGILFYLRFKCSVEIRENSKMEFEKNPLAVFICARLL